MKEYFENLLKISNIEISDNKIEKLLEFLKLLVDKNKVMNLTAIREEKEILEKHFIDSLLLAKLIKEKDEKIIDLGTGAGFPGLVLSIYFEDKKFLLVDSVKKKINFINEVIEKLNLKNVKTSDMRAEELIKNNREKFDLALCRGVANLRIILEYLIPFIKVKGRFLPQKLNESEIQDSKNALSLLSSSIKKIHKFKLPISNDDRIIIEIIKNKETKACYPRKVGLPTKNPL